MLTACGDGPFGVRAACTPMPRPAATISSTPASAPANRTRCCPAAALA